MTKQVVDLRGNNTVPERPVYIPSDIRPIEICAVIESAEIRNRRDRLRRGSQSAYDISDKIVERYIIGINIDNEFSASCRHTSIASTGKALIDVMSYDPVWHLQRFTNHVYQCNTIALFRGIIYEDYFCRLKGLIVDPENEIANVLQWRVEHRHNDRGFAANL